MLNVSQNKGNVKRQMSLCRGYFKSFLGFIFADKRVIFQNMLKYYFFGGYFKLFSENNIIL